MPIKIKREYNAKIYRNYEICKLSFEGFTYKEIGKIFGISKERVRHIICREKIKWRNPYYRKYLSKYYID